MPGERWSTPDGQSPELHPPADESDSRSDFRKSDNQQRDRTRIAVDHLGNCEPDNDGGGA